MTVSEIKRTQERVGAKPDGFWGPKSIAACQRHLKKMMPNPHPFPRQDQGSLTKFYGLPGKIQTTQIETPFPIYLYANKQKPVPLVLIHAKLAKSLRLVFEDLERIYPTEADRDRAGVNRFYGVFNNRVMRGGSLPSLHARAAAIDLDANRNGNKTAWPQGSNMPIEVMEAFARQGWLSAGAMWGRDAMHFQATQ